MPVEQMRQVLVDHVREAAGSVQQDLLDQLLAPHQRQAAAFASGIDRQNQWIHLFSPRAASMV